MEYTIRRDIQGGEIMDGYTGLGTNEKCTSEGKYPCIRISDLTEMGVLEKPKLKCMSEKHLLRKGDILFARVGDRFFKSYLYDPSDGELAYASFLIRFHIEKDNPKYIQYYALSSCFQQQLHKKCGSSTRNVINASDYQDMPILHPDRKTQDKIVEKIAPAYESYVVANKKEKILDAYVKNWFSYYFGPGKQVGVTELSVLADRKNGLIRKDTKGPVPLFNSGGITGGVHLTMPEEEAILIPKKGSLSRVYFASRPFWASNTMMRILPKKKYDLYFLYCLLHECDLMTLNSDSNVPGIQTDALDHLEIPLYPDELRKQFYMDMKPVFSEIGILRKKQRLLESVFHELCERFFR